MKIRLLILAMFFGLLANGFSDTNSFIEKAGKAAIKVATNYHQAQQAKLAEERKQQQAQARLVEQQKQAEEEKQAQENKIKRQQRMEALFALFAVGTFWFWILMAVVAITITAFIENEKFVFPSILSAILVAIYWKTIHEAFNWRALLLIALLYTVCGCLWSIFRWYRHVRETANHFKTRYGLNLSASNHGDLLRETTVGRYKSKVTAWIAFWPMSMFWNLFGDILTALYENMVKIYTSISRRHTSQFTKMSPEQESTERNVRAGRY
jgi:cation transport ATPase